MAAYDDYEQGERVREWIRQNGLSVVIGIVAGLVLIFGYRYWEQSRDQKKVEAAAQYGLVQNYVYSDRLDEARAMADSLESNHEKSAYTVFANMLLARAELDADKPEAAIDLLQKAVDLARDDKLKDVARIRLARVQAAHAEPDAALQTLGQINDGAFDALVSELRADMLAKTDKPQEAVKHYQQALDAYDQRSPQYEILQMKLNSLPQAHTNS